MLVKSVMCKDRFGSNGYIANIINDKYIIIFNGYGKEEEVIKDVNDFRLKNSANRNKKLLCCDLMDFEGGSPYCNKIAHHNGLHCINFKDKVFKKGDRVISQWGTKKCEFFWRGTIINRRGNKYDILYDDGDIEYNKPVTRIRKSFIQKKTTNNILIPFKKYDEEMNNIAKILVSLKSPT